MQRGVCDGGDRGEPWGVSLTRSTLHPARVSGACEERLLRHLVRFAELPPRPTAGTAAARRRSGRRGGRKARASARSKARAPRRRALPLAGLNIRGWLSDVLGDDVVTKRGAGAGAGADVSASASTAWSRGKRERRRSDVDAARTDATLRSLAAWAAKQDFPTLGNLSWFEPEPGAYYVTNGDVVPEWGEAWPFELHYDFEAREWRCSPLLDDVVAAVAVWSQRQLAAEREGGGDAAGEAATGPQPTPGSVVLRRAEVCACGPAAPRPPVPPGRILTWEALEVGAWDVVDPDTGERRALALDRPARSPCALARGIPARLGADGAKGGEPATLVLFPAIAVLDGAGRALFGVRSLAPDGTVIVSPAAGGDDATAAAPAPTRVTDGVLAHALWKAVWPYCECRCFSHAAKDDPSEPILGARDPDSDESDTGLARGGGGGGGGGEEVGLVMPTSAEATTRILGGLDEFAASPVCTSLAPDGSPRDGAEAQAGAAWVALCLTADPAAGRLPPCASLAPGASERVRRLLSGPPVPCGEFEEECIELDADAGAGLPRMRVVVDAVTHASGRVALGLDLESPGHLWLLFERTHLGRGVPRGLLTPELTIVQHGHGPSCARGECCERMSRHDVASFVRRHARPRALLTVALVGHAANAAWQALDGWPDRDERGRAPRQPSSARLEFAAHLWGSVGAAGRGTPAAFEVAHGLLTGRRDVARFLLRSFAAHTPAARDGTRVMLPPAGRLKHVRSVVDAFLPGISTWSATAEAALGRRALAVPEDMRPAALAFDATRGAWVRPMLTRPRPDPRFGRALSNARRAITETRANPRSNSVVSRTRRFDMSTLMDAVEPEHASPGLPGRPPSQPSPPPPPPPGFAAHHKPPLIPSPPQSSLDARIELDQLRLRPGTVKQKLAAIERVSRTLPDLIARCTRPDADWPWSLDFARTVKARLADACAAARAAAKAAQRRRRQCSRHQRHPTPTKGKAGPLPS